jgi:hypothetical protein
LLYPNSLHPKHGYIDFRFPVHRIQTTFVAPSLTTATKT